MTRAGLIILQIVGALSILPYPFVLLANIMSIAAPGQTRIGALPFLLLSGYPLVWIGLYWFAWRAMSRGEIRLAFGLSSIPLLACVGFAGLWASSGTSLARFNTGAANDIRKKIQPVNPLLWTIWCAGGANRFPPAPTVPVEQAIQAIEANPTLVNLAVPPYGTPLKVAVLELPNDLDGSPVRDSARQQELFRMVRALVARGANFGPDEKDNLRQEWLLKRAMHEGPITTASENPLVWRILTRKRDGVTLFSLRKDEIPLLNKTTQLHGTPLYASLLQDAPDVYPELINAGGRLSQEEERDPAAAAALAKLLEHSFELRRAYTKAPQ